MSINLASEEILIVEHRTDKPGFFPVYHELIDTEGNLLSGEEKLLYILLLRFLEEKKEYEYPSLTKLSALTGWGRNKLTKHIKSLKEKGLIK